MWSLRYEAKLELQGWMYVLDGDEKVPKDEEIIDAKDLAKLEMKRINKMIFADLLLSCMDEISFGCIAAAKTNDHPKGNAKLAWKNLKERYESTTEASKV